jgi:threonine synthase
MRTTEAFVGLDCIDCGTRHDPAATTGRCPACEGILDPAYDLDRVDLTRADLESRTFDSMWRYEELLPFPREAAIELGAGATPLHDCPRLAERMGVERVVIKDEGFNPTGTFKDRGQAAAMTGAVEFGAESVSIPSAGNAGHAHAAYASRAGLDASVFLPTRAGDTQKTMVRAHGADLTEVPGPLPEAGTLHNERAAEAGWHSLKTFVTPYRHDGKKTMFYESAEQMGWESPDAVVYPTGGGVGLIGMYKAAREFDELGLTDDRPSMYAAQSTGCAPVVDAFEAGAEIHEAVTEPDTFCNGIEVPDPGASPWVLSALRESDGGAVATTDEEILGAALDVCRLEGVEMGVTCAAAASGAMALAERGEFDADETVLLLNTGAGIKDTATYMGGVEADPGQA